eukprot:CAMPEP_0172553542 /NCGR_PEP_ID=MMETSP1067-20121228/51267_1 /TAXON_ID=265564 ORGANISM="Thalassiosira punctigera, Strain Tpunct2005C2" /NCGR_SAMPLE_ID=MMETSP1067 /ASSEMBLY_ACC=CAM_ASM_000444 /LENGTH=420 /DNA_ID=CAMNT_0013341749 /DNA_START=95 /DNA_END=1357 /DNA_ORIENTATION=+
MPNEQTPLVDTATNEAADGSNEANGAERKNAPFCSAQTNALLNLYEDNRFVVHIALAIGLAKLYPPIGAVYLLPNITATWLAVVFIFAMAGLSLKSDEFARSLSRIGFNAYVQAFNFGAVSLLVRGVSRAMLRLKLVDEGLASGMVICGCLPVTVSMVIVLTKSADGDEAAAVLNAALGSLLGVFVSPLLILSYTGVRGEVDVAAVFLKLCLRVLVPVAAGQALQKRSRAVVAFVAKNKRQFKTCQEWALVLIVYTAFCKNFSSSQPVEIGASNLLWMALGQLFCLLLSMWSAWASLKVLYRNEPRLRVMGFYGCHHKSVAMGIPMLNAIYENDPMLGIYTLPLLIWHPAQLMVGSSLAPKLAEGVEDLERYLDLSDVQRRPSARRSFFAERPKSERRESLVAFEVPEDQLESLDDEFIR